MVKPRVIRLRAKEGKNGRDQITSYAFHSFLVEVQNAAGYAYTCCACVIANLIIVSVINTVSTATSNAPSSVLQL